MFSITSAIRTSAALAAAMLLGQIVAGCSGATPALPGGAAAPAAHVSQHQGVRPDNCDGCNKCPANAQYGTWWIGYTNPTYWVEYTGFYVWVDNNGVYQQDPCGTYTQDQACNPVSWSNCPPQNPWWQQMTAISIANEKAAFAVNVPLTNHINVLSSSAKKGYQLLSTLSTADATPVAVAGDHYGSIYASVFTDESSIEPAVYVYQAGATSPSSTLTDANANGDSPAGVAVDRRRDVFFAYDVTSGSASTIQIDEFPSGADKPMPFATIPGSGGGALAVTTKGEIVATSPSQGMVYAFASTGKRIASFAAAGSPSSIALDRKDQNLYVTDGTNNAVSVYSFPSGALVESGSLTDKEGDTMIPASMLPRDPQLP